MMSKKDNNLLFPLILASTVHDIKNSLGSLQGVLQQLAQKLPVQQLDEILKLEFEASRINHSLMQLLVMYKIDSRKFSLHIDEYPAIDLINEAKAQLGSVQADDAIQVIIECSEDLICYCDQQYVTNALGTILNNARRYTKSTVIISAGQQDDYIRFCIEDDGKGYPEHLLKADLSNPAELDWVKGNTGLGLYFVSAIAGFHKSRDKTGYVNIDNCSRIQGARFNLFLP